MIKSTMINNGIIICWAASSTYNGTSNTNYNKYLTLPTTYSTTYRVLGSIKTSGANGARTGICLSFNTKSQCVITLYCHDYNFSTVAVTCLTIGY